MTELMTNEIAEKYLAAASDETLAIFAAWIRFATERFYVMDGERRILTILSEDLLNRRWSSCKCSKCGGRAEGSLCLKCETQPGFM